MLGRLVRSALATARRSLRRRLNRLRGPGSRPELSIIVCSVDDRRFAQCRANWRERLADRRYELIRIPDATGLAEGYNRGLELSRGELLVFCHDDIEILQPDIYARIVEHLGSADLVGIAGTSRLVDGGWFHAGQPDIHGQVVQPAPTGEGFTLDIYGTASQAAGKAIQALDGVFLAARRGVAEALRFDAETFDGFHLYDVDFTYRAYLAGYRLAVCHDILIYHRSRGRLDKAWRRYSDAFQHKHGERLSRAPAGPRQYAQLRMRDTAEALALFEGFQQRQTTNVPIG
jgi:GT2 family glycosyltransferase